MYKRQPQYCSITSVIPSSPSPCSSLIWTVSQTELKKPLFCCSHELTLFRQPKYHLTNFLTYSLLLSKSTLQHVPQMSYKQLMYQTVKSEISAASQALVPQPRCFDGITNTSRDNRSSTSVTCDWEPTAYSRSSVDVARQTFSRIWRRLRVFFCIAKQTTLHSLHTLPLRPTGVFQYRDFPKDTFINCV